MSVGYIAHESPLNLERDGAESFGEGSYLLGIALRLNRTMANTIFTASLRLQVRSSVSQWVAATVEWFMSSIHFA